MRYSALVMLADKDQPLGDLLAIAGAEAKKRHGLKYVTLSTPGPKVVLRCRSTQIHITLPPLPTIS